MAENTVAKKLDGLDVTVIIDRSGSMAAEDQRGGKSRWEGCREGVTALTAKALKYDEDGIELITFSGKVRNHGTINSTTAIDKIFTEYEPNDSTNLTDALTEAFNGFFARKKNGQQKPNGELFLIVTDGSPDNQTTVKNTIISATKGLDKDEELGLLFVQIGSDPGAKKFLQALDDDLVKEGAKFDIVNTLTMDEVGERTLSEVFASAFED